MKQCSNCNEMPPRYIHTLTVEKPKTVADDAGFIDLTEDSNWVTVGQIKANIITKGGAESYVFKQVQATTDMVLKSPSTTLSRSLDPSWRLRFKERKLNIVAAYLINETGKVVQIEVQERRQP